MSKELENKYFIILNKKEIIFSCLSNENKISLIKKHNLKDNLCNQFIELKNFLTNNLMEIERSLNSFIERIYIILDQDNNLNANLSIKYKLEEKKIKETKINDLLSFLKYQFTKFSNDQKVIHMTLNKLLIDGEEKDFLSVRETLNEIILEVKFICLKNQNVDIIKNIFSNYQISVEKFFLLNHLSESDKPRVESIIIAAHKILIGESNNEITWVTKKSSQQGFFERFFAFFS